MDTTAIRDAALRCRALLRDGLRAGSEVAGGPRWRQRAVTHLLHAAGRRMLLARGVDGERISEFMTYRSGWGQNGEPAGLGRLGDLDAALRSGPGAGDGEFSDTCAGISDVLDDPALSEAWKPGNEEALGWLYQYFNEPDLDVFRGSRPPKVPAELLPLKTQLFTPRWIVRYLVENTLGRLWLQMHPDSQLAERMEYLVPLAKSTDLASEKGASEKGSEKGVRSLFNELAPNQAAIPQIAFSRAKKASDPFLATSRAKKASDPFLAREIRVLDPACGAMHFGLVVFDLLVEMYREELHRAGRRGWPARPSVESEAEIPAAILANNLFGFDIDPLVVRLSALTLHLKAFSMNPRMPVVPMGLHCADVLRGKGDTLWSERANSDAATAPNLAPNYDVVVTNPPYLDSRDFDEPLKQFLADAYPAGKRNLYAAFVERCLAFLPDGGRLGMITPQTFMFISSFAKLRAMLRKAAAIETLVQGGLNTFPDAVVDAAFYVLRREEDAATRERSVGRYFRLTRPAETQAKRRAFERAVAALRSGESDEAVFTCRQGEFDHLPSRPWVYWITPGIRELFDRLPRLSEIARPIVGLQTSDNFRFLRFWWEVYFRDNPRQAATVNCHIAFGCTDRASAIATGRRWFPHIKGGDFRRWYGNQEYVVNWAEDGAEIRNLGIESGKVASRPQNVNYYFRPGVTWTHTSSRGLSVRVLPPGFICNVEGMAAFQKGQAGSSLETLAVMNSSFARHVIDLLNPTVHFGGREVGDLPYPRAEGESVRLLESHVERAIELARADSTEEETTWDFVQPPDWRGGLQEIDRRRKELADIERRIDEEVYGLYGLGSQDQAAIESDLNGCRGEQQDPVAASKIELAHAWISHAVGVVMGRFQPGVQGSLGCGRIDARADAAAAATLVSDGIAVLSGDGREDLAVRVERALCLMLGQEDAREVMITALGPSRCHVRGLRSYLAGPFFRRHFRQYRERPIYWLLQSPGRQYQVYLYYERLDTQILQLLRSPCYFAADTARATESGDSSRLADLQAFDAAINRVLTVPDEHGEPVGWRLEPDDGILINAAPLRELMPLWSRNLSDCWDSLERGEYDWSYTAARYWPDRVQAACKKNKSYALAHRMGPLEQAGVSSSGHEPI